MCYETFLLENHPELIHCKQDLVYLVECGFDYEGYRKEELINILERLDRIEEILKFNDLVCVDKGGFGENG